MKPHTRPWQPPPMPDNPPVVIISLRSSQILSGLCCGLTQKEMARGLGVKLNTIKTHNTRLYRQMGVRCATEAVAAALGGKLEIRIRMG